MNEVHGWHCDCGYSTDSESAMARHAQTHCEDMRPAPADPQEQYRTKDEWK